MSREEQVHVVFFSIRPRIRRGLTLLFSLLLSSALGLPSAFAFAESGWLRPQSSQFAPTGLLVGQDLIDRLLGIGEPISPHELRDGPLVVVDMALLKDVTFVRAFAKALAHAAWQAGLAGADTATWVGLHRLVIDDRAADSEAEAQAHLSIRADGIARFNIAHHLPGLIPWHPAWFTGRLLWGDEVHAMEQLRTLDILRRRAPAPDISSHPVQIDAVEQSGERIIHLSPQGVIRAWLFNMSQHVTGEPVMTLRLQFQQAREDHGVAVDESALVSQFRTFSDEVLSRGSPEAIQRLAEELRRVVQELRPQLKLAARDDARIERKLADNATKLDTAAAIWIELVRDPNVFVSVQEAFQPLRSILAYTDRTLYAIRTLQDPIHIILDIEPDAAALTAWPRADVLSIGLGMTLDLLSRMQRGTLRLHVSKQAEGIVLTAESDGIIWASKDGFQTLLPAVRALVAQHGGKMREEGERNARIIAVLPLSPAGRVAEALPRAPAAQTLPTGSPGAGLASLGLSVLLTGALWKVAAGLLGGPAGGSHMLTEAAHEAGQQMMLAGWSVPPVVLGLLLAVLAIGAGLTAAGRRRMEVGAHVGKTTEDVLEDPHFHAGQLHRYGRGTAADELDFDGRQFVPELRRIVRIPETPFVFQRFKLGDAALHVLALQIASSFGFRHPTRRDQTRSPSAWLSTLEERRLRQAGLPDHVGQQPTTIFRIFHVYRDFVARSFPVLMRAALGRAGKVVGLQDANELPLAKNEAPHAPGEALRSGARQRLSTVGEGDGTSAPGRRDTRRHNNPGRPAMKPAEGTRRPHSQPSAIPDNRRYLPPETLWLLPASGPGHTSPALGRTPGSDRLLVGRNNVGRSEKFASGSSTLESVALPPQAVKATPPSSSVEMLGISMLLTGMVWKAVAGLVGTSASGSPALTEGVRHAGQHVVLAGWSVSPLWLFLSAMAVIMLLPFSQHNGGPADHADGSGKPGKTPSVTLKDIQQAVRIANERSEFEATFARVRGRKAPREPEVKLIIAPGDSTWDVSDPQDVVNLTINRYDWFFDTIQNIISHQGLPDPFKEEVREEIWRDLLSLPSVSFSWFREKIEGAVRWYNRRNPNLPRIEVEYSSQLNAGEIRVQPARTVLISLGQQADVSQVVAALAKDKRLPPSCQRQFERLITREGHAPGGTVHEAGVIGMVIPALLGGMLWGDRGLVVGLLAGAAGLMVAGLVLNRRLRRHRIATTSSSAGPRPLFAVIMTDAKTALPGAAYTAVVEWLGAGGRALERVLHLTTRTTPASPHEVEGRAIPPIEVFVPAFTLSAEAQVVIHEFARTRSSA